jgi:hypothetical protein
MNITDRSHDQPEIAGGKMFHQRKRGRKKRKGAIRSVRLRRNHLDDIEEERTSPKKDDLKRVRKIRKVDLHQMDLEDLQDYIVETEY